MLLFDALYYLTRNKFRQWQCCLLNTKEIQATAMPLFDVVYLKRNKFSYGNAVYLTRNGFRLLQ